MTWKCEIQRKRLWENTQVSLAEYVGFIRESSEDGELTISQYAFEAMKDSAGTS